MLLETVNREAKQRLSLPNSSQHGTTDYRRHFVMLELGFPFCITSPTTGFSEVQKSKTAGSYRILSAGVLGVLGARTDAALGSRG